jgi:hypothetical protein
MSDSMLHAFFVGRALAEVINERAERLLTDGLSWVGQFDAEQRENLRQLTEEVMARASQSAAAAATDNGEATATAATGFASNQPDLQVTIDNLRAEIAQVRVALQQYRSTT